MNVLAPALIFSALASKEFDVAAQRLLMLGSVGVVLGSGLLAWPFARLLHVDRAHVRAADDVQQLRQHGAAARGARLRRRRASRRWWRCSPSRTCCSSRSASWIIDHHARFGNLLRNPMVLVDVRWASRSRSRIRRCRSGSTSRIKLIGDALIPMMLLSLGVRLAEVRWDDWQLGVIGGIVCPADRHRDGRCCWRPLLGLDPTAARAPASCSACLPPAVLNFMVAEQFRQEPAQGRVDRADRQRAVGRVRAARPRARAAR